MKKLHTYIFVHDQNIILDFIKHNKFEKIKNLTYVFVGKNDSSLIKDLTNVIICNQLKYNIEEFPKLTSFTGWYSIWKNELYDDSEYINLFEYDVNLDNNFIEILQSNLDSDIIGYIPFSVHNEAFLKTPMWCDDLVKSISKNYNLDSLSFIKNLPSNKLCSMTSNHTFSLTKFKEYMEWMSLIVDDLKISPMAGHQTERSISLFYLIKKLNYKIIPNILFHFQFDSHKTQNISQDKFNKFYKNLF